MADEARVETTATEDAASETQAAEGEEQQTEQSGEPTNEALLAQLADAQAALKRANAESASRRKKLAKLEKDESDREAAQLSEVEKAQKSAQEWEDKHVALTAELDAARMRQSFYEEADAQKLAFVNAQAKRDAFSLSDLSGVVVDDGTLTGMDDAVKALVKSHPHLFGVVVLPDTNATATGPGASEATEDELIEFAARMGLNVANLDPALVAQAMQ